MHVGVPAVSENFPATHNVHFDNPMALADLPATQAGHSCCTDPSVALARPGVQWLHVLVAETWAVNPAGQAVQVVEPLSAANKPGAQGMGLVRARFAMYPGNVKVQLMPRSKGPMRPAGHVVHVGLPPGLGEYVPARQASHLVAMGLGAASPGLHLKQGTTVPIDGAACPGTQRLQMTEPLTSL